MASKQMTGIVISDKGTKTIVVRVDRRRRHALYSKSYTLSKKWTVHDEQEQAHVGDTVRIIEARPISKTKSWRLEEVLERALGTAESAPDVETKKKPGKEIKP